MRRFSRFTVAVALVCSLCVSAVQGSVLLIDSAHNAYLHSGQQDMTPEVLQGAVAALTGLLPEVPIHKDAEALVQGVVRPSPLKKPQAYLSVNLMGCQPGDLAEVFKGRNKVEAPVPAGNEQQGASDLLIALSRANPAVRFHLVEHLAAASCRDDDTCIAGLLPDVAAAVGAAYDGGKLFLADSVLDFEGTQDRVLMTELASVMAGVKALAGQADQDIVVADMTLTGLSSLAREHGVDAAKVVAARDAVKRMLTWTTQQLDSMFNGDVAIQVVLLDGQGSTPFTVDDATAWKSERHARMLQQTVTDVWPPVDPVRAARQYSTKAAAYGSFILLLYFSLMAAHCLCNMPFKRDSLLYGSKKTE